MAITNGHLKRTIFSFFRRLQFRHVFCACQIYIFFSSLVHPCNEYVVFIYFDAQFSAYFLETLLLQSTTYRAKFMIILHTIHSYTTQFPSIAAIGYSSTVVRFVFFSRCFSSTFHSYNMNYISRLASSPFE